MIHPPEKKGKKKYHTALHEKIIGLVGKYPRSALALYDACRNDDLSRPEFYQLLDEMNADGDIIINANKRVLLPEKPPQAPADNPKPTDTVENRTQPANMGVDEILKHAQQRAETQAGDCVHRVEHDAHIDNLPHGIYALRHSGNKKVRTSDFERAGFSIMPTNNKGDPISKYSQYWNTRRKARHWGHQAWRKAYGLQLFTGEASRKSIDGTAYYPICWDIEEGLLKEHPDLFRQIVEWAIAIPGASLMISKSGGLRINAWVTFVREKNEQIVARREWYDPDDASKTNGITYAEILSGKGLARIDERYLLAKGRIDEFPVLTESEFMKPLEWLAPLDDRIRKSSPTGEAIPALDEGLPDGLAWKQGDNFLISTQRYDCEQDHSSNPSCEYRKHNNGTITKWCWACQTSWKVASAPKQLILPPDHPILTAAPPVEVRETPSFRHFSKEERQVVSNVLSLDPDAGWHGQTPIFTTRYEYLHPLTNKFALNGQPSEVEKRRVWSTLFGNCEHCGAVTAHWVDRYLLTAGYYCDGCHKDYPLGSYLELELNRKLPNSIVSQYQGFLGDDPEFADFRLWQSGILTHLAAGMSTGKSTEINNQMTLLARQGLGKGIIAFPRVSLTRSFAHYLRQRDGKQAWGLWYEGCQKSDKFIGTYGAIVCLPSLPHAVKSATNAGVQRLYIAIDEIDFCYNLLSVSVEQARAVKKCLRDALNTTGLVVSGQTESTLALEALAEELECEQGQAYYNTAKPADGHVVMHKYPNTEGKSNTVLSGGIDDISDALKAGHNVYGFCSSRRDGDVIADVFQHENPVIYNAYTKGDPRADAVLKNQRLTDSRLFIATSAAGVGISILDPKARTIILNGLNFGSRDASMSAQKGFRDRGRRGVSYHYTEYDLPLPVRPTENENVSIYHEAVKQTSRDEPSETAGIRKIALAQALDSLADTQFETFIEHHLGVVGNMPVSHTSALVCDPERAAAIAKRRSQIRETERQKRIATAVDLLNQRDILLSSEIRKLSNNGTLSPDMRLAHETANAVLQAVGWDEKTDIATDGLNTAYLDVAMRLTKENIDTQKLAKQRRGYLAVNFPDWTAHQFQEALEESQSQRRIDGLGIEITAIDDDRFRGKLLKALLARLIGKVFDTESLATVVREVLTSDASTGKSFGAEILSGALGASAYRKARFLHLADDDGVLDWVSAFISEWYPARIGKNEDTYTLSHAKNLNLRLTAFSLWLVHQPGVPDGTQIDLDIFEPIEPPNPNAELENVARFRREAGETIKEIAESLNRNPRTISKWCEGIKPPTPAQRDVLSILSDGKVWKKPDIVAHSRFARRNVTTALKKLLDADKIRKIKRGFYQIQN